MKQFYLPIRNMLLGLMLCGCIDDPPPLSAPGGQTIAFSVSEAKNYFDSTATELRQVFFGDTPLDGTKAVSENRIVLAPRWDKARTSSNDQVTLVEIPIETSQLTRAAVRRHYDSGAVMGTRENVFYKLVVARRANGIMETFVVTLIPDYKYKSGGKDYVDDFHFLGGGDFTGMAFCSELNGRFVVAYAYANGRKTKALDVVLSAEVKVPEEEVYAKVQLANFSTLNSKVGAYPDGECRHGNWADNCEQCLDEVTVIATCLVCGHRGLECGCCQKCRVPYHQNCVHRPCVWCFSFPCQCATCVHCYSNPCRCTYCPKCHKRFCYGQCETYDDNQRGCPYGKCRMDPCICCPICYGPCKCPWKICHKSPCECCEFCLGPCHCSQCHTSPCVCPCYDLENNEADPFKGATISTDNISWKSNVFGMNRNNGTKLHDGIDLIGVTGITPVQAMHPGVVIRVVTEQPDKIYDPKLKRYVFPPNYTGDDNGAGNRLTIRSTLPDGRTVDIYYWHLDIKDRNPYTQKFKVGDTIRRGQAIGMVGWTGNANKDFPHLHLKMQFPGTKSGDSQNNPEPYLYTKFDSETGKVSRSCNN